MSRHYEVMIILDSSFDERNVSTTLENYLKVIRESGGNVENIDVWGRRRLSYEIRKQTEGIYVVLDLYCETDAVNELERQLSLQETVLRTKVVRKVPPRGTKKAAAKAAAKV